MITISDLRCMKKKGEKIAVLTAYDATFAKLIDRAGAEIIMVGDSLGMVVQGHKNTLPVTTEDMIYHTKAVKRGVERAHVVTDMPFMSYQASVSDAVTNAGRLVKDGGAESVKLEGGVEAAEAVRAIISAGIPVMGHIGLQPQSIHKMGGYRIQGRTSRQSERLMEAALALEEAGAYSIVLEGIAMETAAEITRALRIPTIGISSGPDCDGQVLVIYDLLGMDKDFSPKFVKRYAGLAQEIDGAVSRYIEEVKNGAFPAEEHCFHMNVRAVDTAILYGTDKRQKRDAGAK